MVRSSGDPAERAAAFQRIRDAHQTEIAEDYVELVEDLITDQGEARLADLARYLGVSRATATKTVQRLRREGLLDGEPYGSILLTPSGRALASKARRRHKILFDFLIHLGVDAKTAAADAEGMEHHVSEQTLQALERLTRSGAA